MLSDGKDFNMSLIVSMGYCIEVVGQKGQDGDWRSVDSCVMYHHQAGQGPVPGESMTQPHGKTSSDSCVNFPMVEENILQRHATMSIESFPPNLSRVKHP